jgi:hypothetical protein
MKACRRLYVAAILVAIGCGGATSNDTSGDNGGADGGLDGTTGGDGGSSDGTTTSDGAQVDSSKPGTGPIQCGQATCDSATQDCCLGGGTGRTCVTKGTCTTSTLSCTSAANCPGAICCGSIQQRPDGGFGVTVSATCQASCSAPGEVQLCEQNSECASGECRDSILNNVKTCRQRFDGGFPFDAGGGG